ncbi:MAG: zinc ribbon domain-containing protein [Candidatus Aminicenantales bacterium]
MAASTGKTIALILLIMIILLLGLRFTPLIIAPFGIFTSITRMIKVPGFDEIHLRPWGIRFTSFSFLSFALFILWIVVIVWVYRDAERRGMNGVLWALLVLIGNIIGLIIYLIVRSDTLQAIQATPPRKTCPGCKKSVEANYIFCPHCGTRIEEVCSQCKRPVEPSWNVCPICGATLKSQTGPNKI